MADSQYPEEEFEKFRMFPAAKIYRAATNGVKTPDPRYRKLFIKDDTLPSGWKSRLTEKGKQIFLSPDNKIHRSRREALYYMVQQGYSEQDTELIKSQLLCLTFIFLKDGNTKLEKKLK